MKDFRSRKKQFNFLQSPIFLVFLVFVLVLFLKSTYVSFGKKKLADIEQYKFNEKYEQLLKKRDDLIKKNKILETKEGIVKELKEAFNIGESGETVIHIIETKK